MQLLEHAYPGLLDSRNSGQLVEVFVPFPFEGENENETETAIEAENEKECEERDGVIPVMSEGVEKVRVDEGGGDEDVFEIVTPTHSKPSQSDNKPTIDGGGVTVGSPVKGEGVMRVPVAGSLGSNQSSASSRRQLQLCVEPVTHTSSWEILSRRSSTSTRFSFRTVSDITKCNDDDVVVM